MTITLSAVLFLFIGHPGALRPVTAAQRAVLNGLAQVFRLNARSPVQVGNRSRHFKGMRSGARAESPSRVTAFSSRFSPSSEIAQHFRISYAAICALQYVVFSPWNLSISLCRASITRPRTAAESSDEEGARGSLYFTAGTSM
jgi:hypothetical protein